MRKLLPLLVVFICPTMFGYTFQQTCTGNTASGTSISCTLPTSLIAHQTLIAFGWYGHGLNPGAAFSDTSGCTWANNANTPIDFNGISGSLRLGVCGNGTFTGSDTVTMSGGPVADFMYIRVVVYDVGKDPVIDGNAGSPSTQNNQTCTTADAPSWSTSLSNDILFAFHAWGGPSGSSEILSGGPGETVRLNNPSEFSIGSLAQVGLLVEDSQTGVPSTYVSRASSTIAANCWNNGIVAIETTSSGNPNAGQGEPHRRAPH